MIREILIYLAAMVFTVPIAKRLGMGAVLGYLVIGMLLGPAVAGWIGTSQAGHEASHFAEFGVIMMLFLIGLELKPQLLWRLRGALFGMGSAQIGFTVLALFLVLSWMDVQSWNQHFAIASLLALSSTAIALQILEEKSLLKTPAGELSFAVLLFQDLAVIPLLAVLPILAGGSSHSGSGLEGAHGSGGGWISGLWVAGAVVFVIAVGRVAIRPLFRAIAYARLRELFTAVALFLVLGVSVLMESVGLSPALGAFLAGVVLADSEYRHQLEIDIAPFKGLLLGFFFISVGAQIPLRELGQHPLRIAFEVFGLIAIKFAVLFGLAVASRKKIQDALLFGLTLGQGGEFAFVLIQQSEKLGLWGDSLSGELRAVVACSMVVAPLLITVYLKWGLPLFMKTSVDRAPDVVEDQDSPVIVAGIGRFGQTIVRLLRAVGFQVTVLDHDAEQVDLIRKFGMKTYFGDALDIDILRAAGVARARVLVLALDDAERMIAQIPAIRKEFPHLKMMARAFDRVHAYQLINLGVEQITIETSGSALLLGTETLRALGMPGHQAHRAARVFKDHNDKSIRALAEVYAKGDEKLFVSQARSWLGAMETLFTQDQSAPVSQQISAGWTGPPRAGLQSEAPSEAGAPTHRTQSD